MENVFDELNKIYELSETDENFLYKFLVRLFTDLLEKGETKGSLAIYAGYFPSAETNTFNIALDYAEKHPRLYYCCLLQNGEKVSYLLTDLKTEEEKVISPEELEDYLAKYDREAIPCKGRQNPSMPEKRWGWNFYLRAK